MSNSYRLLAVAGLALWSLVFAPMALAAVTDPPGRVARLSDSSGEVGFSPAGEEQWYAIGRNRPLTTGDRLWSERDARAELQFGSTAMRLGPDTGIEILELGDGIAQVQLGQGALNLSVRRMHRGESIEIATPMLAFVIERAGRYRIDVDARDQYTTIVVWEGSGIAYGESGSFPLRTGDAVRYYDSDLRDYELFALPRSDSFDRYSQARDRRLRQSQSLRYVDDDLIGYDELDEYGSWRQTSGYGAVWYPTRVSANWAPYRDGHWVWQEPWGWTWVDDAPWGFAPSHYGRWVSVRGRWGWLPGPRNVRRVYAPALVAFIGGSNWGLSVSIGGSSRDRGSRIGWFPLGPREVYMPSYRSSREYFRQVNLSNTTVNNTTIVNVYNNYARGDIDGAQREYAYRGLAGAVTAVPGDVFRNSQPVNAALVDLDQRTLADTRILNLAPLAPSARSIAGLAGAASVSPAREAFDREVYARNTPPPEQLPFAKREQQLERNPGMGLAAPAQPAAARPGNARSNLRVLAAEVAARDARAAGSLRQVDTPVAGKPAPLQPLDRTVQPVRPGNAPVGDRGRDIGDRAEQQRQAEARSREEAQQQRQREVDAQQARKQAAEAAERERAEGQRQADERGRAEEQRQAEARVREEAQQQRQREVDAQQARKQAAEAAERQRAEGQRQADERGRAEEQRQAEARVRAEAQQERQREVDAQQARQQAAEAAKRERAEGQRQADERGRAEEQRQAEARIRAEAQQERQREVDAQQARQQAAEAAERQRAEGQRQADERGRAEEQRQAEARIRAEAQQQRQREVDAQQARQQAAEAAEQAQREAEAGQRPPGKAVPADPGSRAKPGQGERKPRGDEDEDEEELDAKGKSKSGKERDQ
jgi:hypothetical protein